MNTALCGERGEGEGRGRGRRGKRKGEEEEVRGGRKKKNTLMCHYKHSNHLATEKYTNRKFIFRHKTTSTHSPDAAD